MKFTWFLFKIVDDFYNNVGSGLDWELSVFNFFGITFKHKNADLSSKTFLAYLRIMNYE